MNPRYPHRVKAYRVVLDTTAVDQEPVKVVLLDSECNSHPTTGGRYTRGKANESNFVLNLPRHTARIVAGDKVEVYLPDRVVVGSVIDSVVSNMTAYIFYDEIKQ